MMGRGQSRRAGSRLPSSVDVPIPVLDDSVGRANGSGVTEAVAGTKKLIVDKE